MAGRSLVFGPMPRETLLTNMSNGPGAASDNDFARPVSEEREAGEEEKKEVALEEGLGRKTDASPLEAPHDRPPAPASNSAMWVSVHENRSLRRGNYELRKKGEILG